jgi:pimeloyl-ACP methyl ester carboxylesterase
MRSPHRTGPVPGTRLPPRRRAIGLPAIIAAMPLLTGGCASIVVKERPILDTSLYEARNTVTPPTAEALALIQAGVALDRQHPEWAITYFRDAAIRVLPQALEEGVSTGLDLADSRGAQGVYRRAIEYLLETAHRQAKSENGSWADVLARTGVGVQGRVSVYDATRWEEVLPTRRFEIKGLRHTRGQGGLGAPVVAHLTREGKWGEVPTETTGTLVDRSEVHFPKSLFRAATAVLRPGTAANEPLAVLELKDPVLQPDPRWQSDSDDRSLPLAYDMTVPLARQLHVTNLNLVGALAVLNPDSYNNRTGIYMLDPYVPGKIPVVLVHGLMSSPAAWTNAMNDLRGDPELRKRYQFWMFFYSTGNPLLASGARFRKALGDVRAQLDPEHQDPAFDRMILIGHSMGGLMSRLAISSSGQVLWNTASKMPPEQVQLDPDLKVLLMEAMFFEPVPTVSRVVFISTPHRGSPLGDELIGRLSSRLIRVPGNILEIRKTLAQLNGDTDVSQAFRGARYATGVAQLGLGNPVLQAINQAPLSEKVPYHSIVGYNGKEPLPAGGDGVVPYTSAHIEGALSELIVSSDHSAQETEAGIQEMRRILTLHYNEYALERKALAAGSTPAIRITRPSGPTPVRYELAPPPASAMDDRMARSGPRTEMQVVR